MTRRTLINLDAAVDRFDAWHDRHKVGVERGFFWFFTVTAHCCLFGIVFAVFEGWWHLAALNTMGGLINWAAAASSADDLRWEKQHAGAPEYPAWVQRVRRCVRVAFLGWSA